MLNCITDNPKLVENMILLAGKQYIYRMRSQSEKIVFTQFKLRIENLYNIELEIPTRKNKVPQHERKWENIVF